MSDTRPVLPPPHLKPNNWRERFVVIRRKLQIASLRTAVFVSVHKSLRLVLLQMAGAFSVLYGISFYSVPAALIVGGLAAILVAERQ